MLPIIVVWTKYTSTMQGRILKLVPCESCKTEYVYVLEREGTGTGTSVYFLNEVGAHDHAISAAEETLDEYLANDFDPIPCPICGHYQRFMFPKLYETKSAWGLAATLVLLGIGGFAAIRALSLTVETLQQPDTQELWRLWVAWSILIVAILIGAVLSRAERNRFRRFDPNKESQQARIEKGRLRATTRADFEAKTLQSPDAATVEE